MRDALVAHARQSILRGSKSFAAASHLFDSVTRERVWLLYAWCRRCDDIADAQDHPDVEELHRRAVAVDDRISISTVYRTVKLFEDAGIIERHDFRDGRSRYEPVPDEHHDHLIDLRNGTVVEFRSEEIEQLQEEIARKLGYRLVGHRLELYGVPLDPKKD
ncbi:MAG: transcriptional repressor [Starkeya sp.]|nr:transcriptional repressor [Starkeya sp.]